MARWNFTVCARRRRLVIMVAVLATLPAAGTLVAFPLHDAVDNLDVIPWVHLVFEDDARTSPRIVVFISDAWGRPRPSYPLTLFETEPASQKVGDFSTDSSGMFALSVNASREYSVLVVYRHYEYNVMVGPASVGNVSVTSQVFDLDFDEIQNSWAFHIVNTVGGTPTADVQLWAGGIQVGVTDALGFVEAELREATTVEFRRGSEVLTTFAVAPVLGCCKALPGRQGPVSALAWLWTFITPIAVPLAAIAVTADRVHAEKASSTRETAQLRPVSRAALGLGEFLGIAAFQGILLFAACAAAVLGASIVFGTAVQIQVALGFIASAIALAAFYTGIVGVIATYIDNSASVLLLMTLLWLLFGFGWNFVAGRAELWYASPHALSLFLFTATLPPLSSAPTQTYESP